MYSIIKYSLPDIQIYLRSLKGENLITLSLFKFEVSNYLTFQTFEFNMPWEQIRDCSLDISVMDFDTIGRNEMIGRLMLGCEYLSNINE